MPVSRNHASVLLTMCNVLLFFISPLPNDRVYFILKFSYLSDTAIILGFRFKLDFSFIHQGPVDVWMFG